MADIRLLERTLARNVAWNKARINFVAKVLIALIQVKSVNLSEVASVFAGSAESASHYKRANASFGSLNSLTRAWQPSFSSCLKCLRRGC